MKLLRLAGVLLLLLAAGFLAVRAPRGVETDLVTLLGGARDDALALLAQHLGQRAQVLLEGPSWDALEAQRPRVERLWAHADAPAAAWTNLAATLRGRADGLLAPATRAKLLRGECAAVAQEAAARLFAGFLPTFLSVKEDPFALAADWLLALGQTQGAGWSFRAGHPACARNGRFYLLFDVPPTALRGDGVRTLFAAVEAFNRTAAPVRAWCCGAPFHTALATEASRREINLLSCLSLAVAFAIGFWLFRSGGFAWPLLAALASAFLLGAAALFAVFARPHVLTFVFGTSLIGLGVDYVYHARAAGGARAVARPLAGSLATTLACLVPLGFAETLVLRQMALFTGAGLLAVFGAVWLLPAGAPPGDAGTPPSAPRAAGTLWKILAALLAGVAALGCLRLRSDNSPGAFYRPHPVLAAGERRLAALSPASDGACLWVEGDTVQEALEREERAGVAGVSALVPSCARQRENAALKRRLEAAEGAAFTALTGLAVPRAAAFAPLEPEHLAAGPLGALVAPRIVKTPRGVALVTPCGLLPPGAPVPRGALVTRLNVRDALAARFADHARETYRLLACSALALALAFLALFRRRGLRYLLILGAANAAALGVLGWAGVAFTYFHALSFFVLAGLGADYAIFQSAEATPGTRRAVAASFLTSVTGFGLLAFTSFPVTRAMGGTFALGLVCAYAFAVVFAPAAPAAPADGAWYRQREQSAGRLRLAFLWGVYALAGPTVLKGVVAVVMAFVYPFARPARAALDAFYRVLTGRAPSSLALFRHLLCFAWTLVDKTDVATGRKARVVVTVRDDAAGRAFLADVSAGRGGFLVSSHLGTVEMLAALPETLPDGRPAPHLHAFQQMGHDAVFTAFLARHVRTRRFTRHAVEEIGVETAVAMQQAIARGELVLMAGDRVSAGSAKTFESPFLGRPCRWPKGVFVFAKLLEAPIWFVTCVRIGRARWEAHFARYDGAPAARSIQEAYVRFLEGETRRHPEQWHHFHPFFVKASRFQG